MQKKKKKWITPQLLVLVRRKPEERVLETCKSGTVLGTPGVDVGKCHGTSCVACASFFVT